MFTLVGFDTRTGTYPYETICVWIIFLEYLFHVPRGYPGSRNICSSPSGSRGSRFENNCFTEMCSVSEAGLYLRRIDIVYHSTLGLGAIKKRKKSRDSPVSTSEAPNAAQTLAAGEGGACSRPGVVGGSVGCPCRQQSATGAVPGRNHVEFVPGNPLKRREPGPVCSDLSRCVAGCGSRGSTGMAASRSPTGHIYSGSRFQPSTLNPQPSTLNPQPCRQQHLSLLGEGFFYTLKP